MADDDDGESAAVTENDENPKIKCKYCKKKVTKDIITCVKCEKAAHKSCSARIRNVKHITYTTMWCCDNEIAQDCFSILIKENEAAKEEIRLLNALVDELQEKNILLKEKIQYMEEKRPEKTYAMATGTVQETRKIIMNNVPSLIVKPKTNQSSTQTKEEICSKIKPAELKVGVSNIKPIRNGGVIIKCKTINNIETLKNEIEKKLNPNSYEIKTTKLKKPTIKITNYGGKQDTAEVEKYIRTQNTCIEENDEFKVTYIKTRRNNSTIFCECSPKVYQKLMNVKKVFIEWQRYPVYDGLQVTRCFKCQEYSHKSQLCQKQVVCEYCGEEHDIRECQKEVKKCKNCVNANIKYNKQYKIDHEASSLLCPTYKYFMEMQRSKTDYGNN